MSSKALKRLQLLRHEPTSCADCGAEYPDWPDREPLGWDIVVCRCVCGAVYALTDDGPERLFGPLPPRPHPEEAP